MKRSKALSVFIIVVIIALYGSSEDKVLDVKVENKNIIQFNSERVISSGYFILPFGDFRGGGAILVDKSGYYYDARVVVNNMDYFFRLRLNLLSLGQGNADIKPLAYSVEQQFIDMGTYSTAISTRVNNWEVKLNVANKEKTVYSAFQNGKKVFTVMLPPIRSLGYIVSIGKASLEKEVEIFYFQTIKYKKGALSAIMQKAVVAYIMVSS